MANDTTSGSHIHDWIPLEGLMTADRDRTPSPAKYVCADPACGALGYRNRGQAVGNPRGEILAYRCNFFAKGTTCGADCVYRDATTRNWRNVRQRCRAHHQP